MAGLLVSKRGGQRMTIKGLSNLNRKLAKLPIVARQMIRQQMEKAADDIVAMMKRLVSKSTDTGDLQMSIGWTWGKAPKGSMVIASVKATGESGMTITIYAGNSKAYYARWVEFGTARHENGGIFDGSIHPGTTAQPFFYVSWRAFQRPAKRAINKAVRDSAKKVARGS